MVGLGGSGEKQREELSATSAPGEPVTRRPTVSSGVFRRGGTATLYQECMKRSGRSCTLGDEEKDEIE